MTAQTGIAIPGTGTTEIRCPRCDRLLARRSPTGSLEVQNAGRRIVRLERGDLICPKDGAKVRWQSPTGPATFRTGEGAG